MKNGAIYSKTLKFSLLRLLIGVLGIAAAALITYVGYLCGKSLDDTTHLLVTGICLVVGMVVFGLIVHYLGYMLKAGQIAMITRGVTEGTLPEDVVAEGKAAVKKRFVTANVYFLIESGIKAITSQITSGLNTLTSAASGNDKGVLGTIASLVMMFINIVLEYVNYCCLGWVFYHPEQNAFKSTCDGAVLYFQNWKTLLKNAGKVMAFTLAAVLIFFAVFCALNIIVLEAALPDNGSLDMVLFTMDDGSELTLRGMLYIGAVLVAFLFAMLLHSTFVKPYLLIMVMRNYMDAAQGSTPGFDVYEKLCGLSKRFKKMFEKSELPETAM
ncbi:MAG: hypothetical protein PHI98_03415 [Eubacteriales bacterium]|nr:hypothetical protein [Eubacteriales bacterium]